MIAYMVMALKETVTVDAGMGEVEIKLEDCMGYIPVYQTLKDAENHSFDGKYEVVPIMIPSMTERAEA